MLRIGRKILSIRITVVFIFVFGTLLTSSAAITLHYLFSSKIVTQAVESYATNVAKNSQDKLIQLNQQAEHSVETLARNNALVVDDKIDQTSVDKLFSNLLENNKEFYAVYIGLSNGDFYELINLEASPVIREQVGASLTDRFAKVIINKNKFGRIKQTIFLNEKFEPSHIKTVNTSYNSTMRPWYKIANQINANKTEPYQFQEIRAPGQTYSMKIGHTEDVVAIDIALSTLSTFMSQQITNNTTIHTSEAFVFKKNGDIIASNQQSVDIKSLTIPQVALLPEEKAYIQSLKPLRISNETDWAPFDYSIAGEPRGYIVEMTQMIANSLGLTIDYVNGFSWSQLTALFQTENLEILAPINRSTQNQTWGVFSDPILDAPMALATLPTAPIYHNLEALAHKTLAIPQGWSIIAELEAKHPQINILTVPSVSEALKAVLNGKADVAIESEIILRYTLDIYYLSGIKIQTGIDISSINLDTQLRYVFQPEYQRLAELFNRTIKNIAPETRLLLSKKWLSNSLESTTNQSTTVPYQQLIDHVNHPESYRVLQRIHLKGQDRFVYLAPLSTTSVKKQYFAIIFNADDVLSNSRRDMYISITITIAFLLVLLPMCWIFANPIVKPIRLLALENRKVMRREYQDVIKHTSMIKEIDELSESLADMSEALSEYEDQQKKLMDSFVETIAQAIDDKSPYTGGHCHRVPELGLMLAMRASQNQSDYFKPFSIEDSDRYREFRLAAWLHDCGKITTPEHVVDKGCKLETSYNRIHEIRTRFEVLWRDAEINYLKAMQTTPDKEAAHRAEWQTTRQQLQNDFNFVAQCNIGSEAMQDDYIERLTQIGATRWMRHFDDRLGLAPLEEKRYPESKQTLPVEESLLADKSQHIIQWVRKPDYAPELNIQLEPTAYQNNQGELYNLSIIKGTLNKEERFRINEHTVGTIKILENLPFPPELANVPRFASTHHETLIGTGYPRKLNANDLSIGERILVLADVFEALTADDRPYKKAKPLSAAIDILAQMVSDQHVDKMVFELFLTSGIYLDYAHQYLKPEQIDTVDIDRYLKHG